MAAIAFRGLTPFLRTSGQLWIDVDSVNALHATLVGKVPIEWGPEVYGYGRHEFAIKDCNGYLLTFSARA